MRFSKAEILVGPLECPIIRVATGFEKRENGERHTSSSNISLVLKDDCMIRGVDGPLLMNHFGKATKYLVLKIYPSLSPDYPQIPALCGLCISRVEGRRKSAVKAYPILVGLQQTHLKGPLIIPLKG